MTKPAAHQLSLPLSGSTTGVSNLVRIPRAKNKKRGEVLHLAASLAIKDRYFLPMAGTPRTRGECPPPSEYCTRIRCRYHLSMIDAEHRAGRPGLANVPRDARGLTVPTDGDLGDERAGTTFDARWLESERLCVVHMERDENGKMLGLTALYEGEADLFLERLHVGEAIDVIDGYLIYDGQGGREPIAALQKFPRVMGARLAPTGNIVFERDPSDEVKGYAFTLRRVRGVESCALHMIDKRGVALSNQEIGDGLGRHRTLVAREVRNGTEKAKREARRRGMDWQDLMRALMTMGERK